MLKLRDIEFHYGDGDFSLSIPELSIEAGSTVAIIGPSGTGKTTLLNLISGVAVPSRGTITVNGVEVSALSDRERRDFRIRQVGFIFQEFELLEYLNVLDNILLPYRISGALQLNANVRSRAAELAEMCGLSDKLKRNVQHLSQGERQRVAICRSLLPNPPLLLADEPTGNLDPENTDKVLEIVFDYIRTSGATLVSVTHERQLLDRFDRVVDFSEFREADAHA